MTDARDIRRNHHPAVSFGTTPPEGVPAHVDPASESTAPVIVADPSMRRPKTPSTPPAITIDEYVRDRHVAAKIESDWRAKASDRITEHGTRLAKLEGVTIDHKAAAAGAVLARRLLAALIAVGVLVPGACFGAFVAFMRARDAAAESAAVVRAAAARQDARLDAVTAEVSGLLVHFAPVSPAGVAP